MPACLGSDLVADPHPSDLVAHSRWQRLSRSPEFTLQPLKGICSLGRPVDFSDIVALGAGGSSHSFPRYFFETHPGCQGEELRGPMQSFRSLCNVVDVCSAKSSHLLKSLFSQWDRGLAGWQAWALRISASLQLEMQRMCS